MSNFAYLQRGLRGVITCMAMVAAAAPLPVWSQETPSLTSITAIQPATFATQFAGWAKAKDERVMTARDLRNNGRAGGSGNRETPSGPTTNQPPIPAGPD